MPKRENANAAFRFDLNPPYGVRTMKVARMLLLVPVVAMLFGVLCDRSTSAQLRIQADTYMVRIVNELGIPIRVGIMGYQKDANYRWDLDTGKSDMQKLYAGQRVVVAWDKSGNLVFAADVDVDRDGMLALTNGEFSEPAGDDGARHKDGPIRKAKIRP
jgi:hypothetical protein